MDANYELFPKKIEEPYTCAQGLVYLFILIKIIIPKLWMGNLSLSCGLNGMWQISICQYNINLDDACHYLI